MRTNIKSIIIVACFVCVSCRVNMIKELVNDENISWDIDDNSKTIYPIALEFGLGDDEDICKYSNDSLHSRLKYSFFMPCPVLPVVKFNSFTFTREKDKDTIPCIFYYRTDGRKVVMIDSLPAVFTNDIKKEMKIMSFQIFVEAEQSFHETEKVYISYDIEVGDKRIIKKNIRYRRKLYIDWQPRLW